MGYISWIYRKGSTSRTVGHPCSHTCRCTSASPYRPTSKLRNISIGLGWQSTRPQPNIRSPSGGSIPSKNPLIVPKQDPRHKAGRPSPIASSSRPRSPILSFMSPAEVSTNSRRLSSHKCLVVLLMEAQLRCGYTLKHGSSRRLRLWEPDSRITTKRQYHLWMPSLVSLWIARTRSGP